MGPAGGPVPGCRTEEDGVSIDAPGWDICYNPKVQSCPVVSTTGFCPHINCCPQQNCQGCPLPNPEAYTWVNNPPTVNNMDGSGCGSGTDTSMACSECGGDCDGDHHCQGALVCFEREPMGDPSTSKSMGPYGGDVWGCIASGVTGGHQHFDFCVDPNKRTCPPDWCPHPTSGCDACN